MTKKELLKRYALFVLSLFVCAFGIALTRHSDLGMSPITSVPNIFSCKYTFLSMGVWLVLWHCLLILGQILILKHDFQPIQFLQLPLSFLFGAFTDFGLWCVSFIPVPNYFVKLCLVFCGVFVLACGVSLAVIANVILNCGEAFVKAIADKTGKNFGDLKVAFDVSCVAISVILSLFFFHGTIIGTRKGTVITALCTGFVVKKVTALIRGPLELILVEPGKVKVEVQ